MEFGVRNVKRETLSRTQIDLLMTQHPADANTTGLNGAPKQGNVTHNPPTLP